MANLIYGGWSAFLENFKKVDKLEMLDNGSM